MKRPDVESTDFQHKFTWEDGVQILVEKVKEEKGNLRCDIAIFSLITKELLYEGPFNLSGSPRVRNELINHVSLRFHGRTKLESPILNLEMIDFVIAYIRVQYGKSDAPKKLHEQPRINPSDEGLSWIVPNYISAGDPTLLYAHGESGKSLVACFTAVIVASGRSACFLEPKKGNVLYLDYEGQDRTNHLRMQAIASGLEMDGIPPGIIYRRCTHPFGKEVQEICKIVSQEEIKLVIVDSFFGASESQKDPASAVRDYFMDIRNLKCSVFTMDHVAKNLEGDKSPYGSVYKQNFSRCVWELTRSNPEDSEDSFNLAMFCKKFNNGPRPKPIGMEISFIGVDPYCPDEILFKKTDPMTDPEMAIKASLKDRVTRSLETGKKTIKEIALDLELETNKDLHRIRCLLNRYKNKKFLNFKDSFGGRENEGYWGIKNFS